MTVVGISGKIGSGKNYLATQITKELTNRGFTVSEGSFATKLKSELEAIMVMYATNLKDPLVFEKLSQHFNIPYDQIVELCGYIYDDVVNADIQFISGYSRTEGIRRGLQFLGTEIRRNVNNNYWVDLFWEDLPSADFIFVTDVRFVNEADSVLAKQGVMFRLEVPKEVIASRTNDRDGLKYSEKAKEHLSETALDDYPNFDQIIGITFDTNALCDYLVQKHLQ